ncbi:retrovirus-related pol polyprotein from transposon TNT 1-94 [Tanacetum coccineum]
MKMEILLEPASNKLMVEHAEFDESNANVLERFYTSAGNPVKEILLKLNLPDHRIRKDGGEVKEFQRSFRHSDTERLSRSDEVLKLKNFKKDATLKLSKSTNQEWYEHVGPEVTRSQDDKCDIRKPIRYLDSGCSRHMIGVKSYLYKYVEQPGPKVVFGDDSTYTFEGYGSIKYNGILLEEEKSKHLKLSCPSLKELKIKMTPKSNNSELTMVLNSRITFCDEKGISQNISSPYTPEQNGVAETKNRTVIEVVITMLSGSVFSKQYWTKAVATACYTQNRSTIVKIHLKTPYEIFHKRIPNINFLHVFGCLVYFHNHKDHPGKFDEKADDDYLLGYSLVSKAFRPLVKNINIAENERYPRDEYLHPYEPSQRVEDTSIQDIIPIPNPPLPIPSVVTSAPQDRWSQDKHIEQVNIIDFLSEEEPKKVFAALKHLGWVDAIQDELNQFARNKV